jgi:hypothetical protein
VLEILMSGINDTIRLFTLRCGKWVGELSPIGKAILEVILKIPSK